MAGKKYLEQKKTLDDVKRKLAKHKKCLIIRPTGFGKTYMMTELIKEYKRVLYLYPATVIKDTVVNRYYDSMLDKKNNYVDENGNVIDPETIMTQIAISHIENCTLMTYAKFARMTENEIRAMKYDLVLMDEAHRLGAPQTMKSAEILFANSKRTRFVGATATPCRMDNFDVAGVFFCNITTYIYTLSDAIRDGILKKPYYCYCTYDIKTDLQQEALDIGENPSDPIISKIIDSKVIEMSKIYNMPNIIYNTCQKIRKGNTSYMKFIVFFNTTKQLDEKIHDVKKWFKTAYPKHDINILKITNRYNERKNTEKLSDLVSKPNRIDLIACVDMLNQGYHVENCTGIIMYRGTSSSTIFIQQLGRALSAGSKTQSIVFDVVDNLHRKAVYAINPQFNKNIGTKSKTADMQATSYVLTEDGLIMFNDNGELKQTQYYFNENGDIVDLHGNLSTLVYDADDDIIYNINPYRTKNNINVITEKDLIALPHKAKYRETIAKAMAEPMAHRCKMALIIHFNSWCKHNGIIYPITREDVERLYETPNSKFRKDFLRIIKKNKLTYPLQDAEKLIEMGKDKNSADIALEICAQSMNVSITQILNTLNI